MTESPKKYQPVAGWMTRLECYLDRLPTIPESALGDEPAWLAAEMAPEPVAPAPRRIRSRQPAAPRKRVGGYDMAAVERRRQRKYEEFCDALAAGRVTVNEVF